MGYSKMGLNSGGCHRAMITHRLLSSSFFGLPSRILNMNHRKELLIRAYGRLKKREIQLQRRPPEKVNDAINPAVPITLRVHVAK